MDILLHWPPWRKTTENRENLLRNPTKRDCKISSIKNKILLDFKTKTTECGRMEAKLDVEKSLVTELKNKIKQLLGEKQAALEQKNRAEENEVSARSREGQAMTECRNN